MLKTITATYEDETALASVFDDLINDGLPRESIFRDEDMLLVKVMIPDTIEPEVQAILSRHHPKDLH